jgi:hypothetical protein
VLFDLLTATVYWHDRIGMAMPPGAPPPLRRENRLGPLVALVIGQVGDSAAL